MSRSLFITTIIFVLILGGAIIFFLFWRLGIFKKEATLSQKVIEVKNQLEFINNYPFGGISNYLKNLSVQTIELPKVNPEEIGREKLF